MKKKIIKIVLIILSISILLTGYSLGYEKINPSDYKPGSITGTNEVTTLANNIIIVIRIVGSGVSVIMLAVIGIKYMTASVEEKAQYKESLKPYVIGAFMLFGIINILGIMMDLIPKLLGDT